MSSIEEPQKLPDTEITKMLRAKKISDSLSNLQKEEEKKAFENQLAERVKVRNKNNECTLFKNAIMYFGRNLSLAPSHSQKQNQLSLKSKYAFLIRVPDNSDKRNKKLSNPIKALPKHKLAPLLTMFEQFKNAPKRSKFDDPFKEMSPIKNIVLQPGVTFSEKGGLKISQSNNNTAEYTKTEYFMKFVFP